MSGSGETAGRLRVYRNFSTFRNVSGVHIEAVHVANENDSATLVSMLDYLGGLQVHMGWHGYTDITVASAQEDVLIPVLNGYGFEPLAYGADRMNTHHLHGDAMEQLACRFEGRSIINGLVPTGHLLAPRLSSAAGRHVVAARPFAGAGTNTL